MWPSTLLDGFAKGTFLPPPWWHQEGALVLSSPSFPCHAQHRAWAQSLCRGANEEALEVHVSLAGGLGLALGMGVMWGWGGMSPQQG